MIPFKTLLLRDFESFATDYVISDLAAQRSTPSFVACTACVLPSMFHSLPHPVELTTE